MGTNQGYDTTLRSDAVSGFHTPARKPKTILVYRMSGYLLGPLTFCWVRHTEVCVKSGARGIQIQHRVPHRPSAVVKMPSIQNVSPSPMILIVVGPEN